ncbi:MAG: HU family DNA-binding protein [Paludibacteraceae bacterium]|nr:HU family DNA-binding protein [Paludibacteraceae bacterium]
MEKLSWTELRKSIAERINADEKEVAAFMSALIPAITKALREDRQVRITNLGTFKLQSVAPRRSVNVATGEAFTLPGYEKLVFAPESSIKELLGNPKASPIEDDNTPLQKLGAQADEIVDILGDLGQGPKATPAEPVVEEPQPVVEEPKAEEPQPVVEEPKPIVAEPIIMTSTKEEKKEKKGRTWLVVGITVLIFALLLAAAFLFVGNRFISWVENLHNKATQTEQVEQVDSNQVAEPTEATDQNNTPEVVEPAQPTQTKSNLPYPYEWKEFIGSERLSEGSRLALLARKYYNETDMWVFIYEANRNTVQHPSDIPVGTKIRLPKIPRELRDLSNPETRKLVDELIVKYKAL